MRAEPIRDGILSSGHDQFLAMFSGAAMKIVGQLHGALSKWLIQKLQLA